MKNNDYIQIGAQPDVGADISWAFATDGTLGKCDICGKSGVFQTWIDGKVVTTRCYEHPYDPYQSKIIVDSARYNYKCPSCGGEFNEPGYGIPEGSYVPKFCPFCNRKMEGI